MANSKKKNGTSKKNDKKKKNSRAKQIVALVVLVVFAAAYFYGLSIEDDIDTALSLMQIERFEAGDVVEEGKLSVHFMDVGQGDACLIELPDNRVMLIDAGENKAHVKDKLDDYIGQVNAQRQDDGRGAFDTFDFVVVTHSDSDHIGSIKYIIEKIPAKTAYRPNQEATYSGYSDPALALSGSSGFWGSYGSGSKGKETLTYKNTIESLYANSDTVFVTNPADNAQNCIKPTVASAHDDYYEVNFYGHAAASYNDSNDYSPIIIITYKNRRIALSGDCERLGEEDFVALASGGSDRYAIFNNEFRVDVIKLGHHGSRTSSSDEYLAILTPQTSYRQNVFLVISCGEGNSYGHPHSEVLERAEGMGFSNERILRTDLQGDIAIDLVLYEGSTDALCQIGGVVAPRRIYHYAIGGIELRYRTLGLIFLAILALILLPLTFLSSKTQKKVKGRFF